MTTAVSTIFRSSIIAIPLILAGCISPPQGYGVAAQQDTAAQAQQQMDKAEQLNQVDSQQTYLNLIRQMQEANQWYASLAHADAFERQHGSTPTVRLLRADAQRNTGQRTQAEQSYQALLGDADTATVARARRGLGLLHAQQGRYPQAIAQLEQARQLNPIDADVLSDLAYAHLLQGDLAGSQLPVMQAAQLAPNSPRVQLNLALYLLASGRDAEAQQLLARLRQPQARNAPPLIDDRSVQTLHGQLAVVQQAMRQRMAGATTPVTETASAAPHGATPPAPQP
ncbi:hypothetical protein CCO03_06400 [Comamonas serinivorans]|uniref:Uncharacterized protein n=1 Tax=Comamonas serinivorans TaxID=1082851 RepID=A0A1Y0EM37_9BURK|nr:tetratricopeptide repeat protein [Comamonas serinivorans]ARU04352.1 hypothetical protein CCO03_06400 [Comamonas serinivorans]